MIAHSSKSNRSISYTAVALADPIDQHLGGIRTFTGKLIDAQRTSTEQRYSIHISAADLASTPRGEVMLRIVTKGIGNSAPPIVVLDHATPVSRVTQGNQVTSLFVATEAGMDLIRVSGPSGSYLLDVSVAGDVNADALVDGNDANTFTEVESTVVAGQAVDSTVDLNGDGSLDFADRLVMLYNYGFTTSTSSFALATGNYQLALERGSDDSDPQDDNTTSQGAVTIAGSGTPFQTVTLSGHTGSAQVLLNGMFAFFDVPLLVGPNELILQAGAQLGAAAVGGATITRIGSETTAPTLTVGLANDTGANNRDRITSVGTLSGTATDVSGIRKLQLARANGPWIDVTSQITSGSYEITSTGLATLLGEPVVDGRYDLRLQAIDALANESPILEFSFVLDTVGPDAPTQLDLSTSSDTGIDDTDNITNRREVILTAFANPGDRVEALLNGQVIGSQLSTGPVSIPITLPGPGSHFITLVSRDEAGNPSAATSPLVISIDETAPSSLTSALSADTDSGVVGDGRTDRETIALVGQTDPGSSVAVYRSSDLNNAIARVTAGANGQYRIDGITLALGSNALVVSAEDIAGNARKVNLSIETTAVDSLAPTIATRLRRDTGRSATDRITSDSTVLATIDDPSGVTALTVSVNGGVARDAMGWLSGALLSLTPSRMASLLGSEVVDGSYTLSLMATDAGGRTSTPSNFNFTLDTTRPTPPSSLDLAAADDTGISSTDNITRLNSFAFSTSTEANSIVRFYRNGQLVDQSTNGAQRSFAVSNLVDGTHLFTVTSEDLAGNISSFSLPTTIVVDRESPGVSNLKLSDRFRTPSLPNSTSFERVSIEGKTQPNANVELLGTTFTAKADATGAFTLQDVPLIRGTNRLEVRTSDQAGNISSGILTVTMEDRNGPTIKINLTQDSGSSTTDLVTSNPAINGSVRDASGVSIVEIRANNSPWLNITNQVVNGFFDFTSSTIQLLFGSALTDGKNILSIRATDGSGLTSVENLTFILDRSAPAVLQPRLMRSDDVGLDEADRVVNTTSVRIYLPVISDYEVSWYLNGSLFQTSKADTNGIFVLTGVPDGVNSFSADVHDSAGSVSERSLPLSITVDTSIPTMSWNLAAASDTGVIGDRRTDTRIVRIEGKTEPYSMVLLESLEVVALADSTGNFFVDRLYLENGENVFEYSVTDIAGNRLESAVRFTYTGDQNDSQPIFAARGSQFALPETAIPTISPPEVNDETYAIDAGQVLVVSRANGLIANDRSTNASRPTLRVLEMNSPSSWKPAVLINSDGSFVFDARQTFDAVPAGQTVTYELFYLATDGVDAKTGRALVRVRGQNESPIAKDDSGYQARTDRPLYVTSRLGVLSNDSDIDRNDRISVIPFTGLSSKGARIVVRADGSFDYDARQANQILSQANLNPGVPDSFTYEIVDRQGARSTAVVQLNVLGRPSTSNGILRTNSISTLSGESTPPSDLPPFEYLVVASPGQYEGIGNGISINNRNSVAFTAVQGTSNAYFWEYGASTSTPVMPEVLQLPKDATEPPYQYFGTSVSLNDAKYLAVQRVIAMKGLVDVGFNFLSPGAFTNALFSYVENWKGGQTIPITATNVVNGDMGLTEAGIWVIDPQVWIALKTASFLAAGFGGMIGFAAFASAGLATPIFTPINPVWAVRYPTQFVRTVDFEIIFDRPVQNNLGKTVFQAQMTKRHGSVRFLATTVADTGNGIRYVGFPIGNGNLQYDVGDNGTIIVNNGTVSSYNSSFSPVANLSEAFTSIGKTASVSDDGSMVAFVGVGPNGTGVYMIPSTGGQPQKLIGISEDGTLDPGETWEDKDGNGQFNGKEDVFGFLDLDFNAQVNIAKVQSIGSGPAEYFVQFAGSRVSPDLSSAAYGLHLVKSSYTPTSNGNAATVSASQISTVVSVGQALPNVGTVDSVSTNDGLSSTGHVAFMVNGNSIFVAQPPSLRAFVDSNNDDKLDLSPLGEDYLNRNKPGEPGRILDSGIGDTDDDGVPDWRDGFNFTTSDSDNKLSTHQFQKLVVQIPDDVVVDARGTIAFRYDSSDPSQISDNPLTGYEPAEGRIRIWKKDGNVAKEIEQDFIGSYEDGKFYTLAELGFSNTNRSVEFYVEGIPILDSEVFEDPKFTLTTRIDVLLGVLDGAMPSFTASDSVNVTVAIPILRIDADNNNGFDLPDLSTGELSKQKPSKNEKGKFESPGRIIVTSKSDSDGDGIPDFADGIAQDGLPDSFISSETQFVPLLVQIPRIPGIENGKFKLGYEGADPELVRSLRIGAGTIESPIQFSAGNGKMRLWKKNGSELRSNDDYMRPFNGTAETIYAFSSFETIEKEGFDYIVFYVESIDSSKSLADMSVSIQIDPDGDGPSTYLFTDTVQFTAIDLTIAFDDRNNDLFSNQTTKALPLNFWLNNDRDKSGDSESQDSEDGTIDSDDDLINSTRDLEDFLAFQIQSSLLSMLPENFQIELTVEGSDSVRLFLDKTGIVGSRYFRDPSVAANLLFQNLPFDAQDGKIGRSEFSVEGNKDTVQFVLEGVRTGAVKLSAVLVNSEIQEKPLGTTNAYLQTRDIKRMYAEYSVGLTAIGANIADPRNIVTPLTPLQNRDNFFQPPIIQSQQGHYGSYVTSISTKVNDSVVFVHGWRMRENEKDVYAETSFKRLFWQGYVGDFTSFTWPTGWTPRGRDGIPDDLTNYNNSEEIAWNSAIGLNQLLVQLGNQAARVHVFAHSMGNVVVSEALRLGATVTSYVATQAASPASAYGDPSTRDWIPGFWDSPEIYLDFPEKRPGSQIPSPTRGESETFIVEGTQNGSENGAIGRFTVTLRNASEEPQTFKYRFSGTATEGDDFNSLSGELVFAPGQVSAIILIGVLDDQDPENAETVTIDLYSSNFGYLTGTGATSATLFIADNDSAGEPYFASLPSKVLANFVNFFNPSDDALANLSWGTNQQYKPDAGFQYDENLDRWLDGTTVLADTGWRNSPSQFIQNRYPIFSHIAEARSSAVGLGATESVFKSAMSFADFGDNHSHQFLGTSMHPSNYRYWRAMLDSFGIIGASTQSLPTVGGIVVELPLHSHSLRSIVEGTALELGVAVLDTGVRLTNSNVRLLGPDFGDGDDFSYDANGHGTELVNSIDQFLLANGLREGYIVSIKATQGDSSNATLESIASSLNWVLHNYESFGIDAVNISLGYGSTAKGSSIATLEPYFKLLDEAGVFVAIAAGNGYGPSSAEGLNSLATSQYVTAVGATWDRNAGYQSFSSGAIDYSTEKDRIASFSQRDRGLDILAPGGAIVTKDINGNTVVRSGTSYAAPQVTAAAAIIRAMADEAGIKITPSEIRELLRSTGKLIFDGDDEDDNVPNTYRYYPLLDTQAAISEMQRRINVARGLISSTTTPTSPSAEPKPPEDVPIIEVTPNNGTITFPADPIIALSNPGLGNPTNTWTFQGNGQLDGSDVLLSEHQQLVSNATRTYALDPSKSTFKFEIRDLLLQDNGAEQPPDALEVALATQATGGSTSFFGRISALNKTDSLLNIQRDGSYYAGAGVAVTGTILANGKLDLAMPIQATVDISALPQDTMGTLSFDLIGFGVPSSSARIIVPEGEPIPNNSIAGFVYVDTNDNGLFDTSEQPISGVTIQLSGTETRTVVTDAFGRYQFLGLSDGTYSVTQVQPDGVNDGRETQGTPLLGTVANDQFIDLVLSNNNTAADNYNFGERVVIVPGNSISGFVYVDANDNGIFDPQELPISGVTVTLSGDANRTAVTDNTGAYVFNSLPDGTYTVTQTQPTGFFDGRESQGTPPLGTVGSDQFTDLVLSGNIVTAVNYNFGELPIIDQDNNSISGFVYIDANDNGIFDNSELPISGVTITLSGPINRTIVTATDGSYRFTQLPDGSYVVSQNQVPGFLDGKETQGTPLLGSVENDRFVGLNLANDIALTGYNFGEREQVAAQNNSISGFVYADINSNGVFEAGEQGIPGVIVQLTGTQSRSITTGSDGSYTFTSLPDGTYAVAAQQPSGYTDGQESQGSPRLGTVGNDLFAALLLSGGNQQLVGYNFGELPIVDASSTISGRVYIDLNRNGVFDSEPGLRQVEVRLTGPVSRTSLTDEFGFYVFRDLPQGAYTVQQIQPAPYDDGQEQLGSLGGIVLPDGFTSIVVDGANFGTGYNFGELLRPLPSRNSIGGVVYLDVNNNGMRDPQERVLPNVQIRLEGPVSSVTVTADNGAYVFTDLPDGAYSIIQIHPADFLDGIDSLGSPASGVAMNDRFEGVVLEDNMIAIEYNFGERGLLNPTKAHLLASTPPADDIIRRYMQGLSRFAVGSGAQESFFSNNRHFQYDTSNDGFVTPLDALVVLNAISQMNRAPEGAIRNYGAGSGFYVDVNGDSRVEPLDALLVLNHLSQNYRRLQGEGETALPDMNSNGLIILVDTDLRIIHNSEPAYPKDQIFRDDEFIGSVLSADTLDVATLAENRLVEGPQAEIIDQIDEALLAAFIDDLGDLGFPLDFPGGSKF